ncbi:MAG: hypothetical protein AAGH15_27390, partial [Myxococcota bacterium]
LLAALLSLGACGGASAPVAQAGPTETSTPSAAEARVERIPVGGCTETSLDADARVVQADGAGWTLVAASDMALRCEDQQVVLGDEGFSLWLGSYVPIDEAARPETMTEFVAEAASVQATAAYDDPVVEDTYRVTHGNRVPRGGYCTWSSFRDSEGPLRLLLCVFHATMEDGVVHLLRIAVSDTPEAFTEDGGMKGVLDDLVDAWFPEGATF